MIKIILERGRCVSGSTQCPHLLYGNQPICTLHKVPLDTHCSSTSSTCWPIRKCKEFRDSDCYVLMLTRDEFEQVILGKGDR
jgi:hypothetical protein